MELATIPTTKAISSQASAQMAAPTGAATTSMDAMAAAAPTAQVGPVSKSEAPRAAAAPTAQAGPVSKSEAPRAAAAPIAQVRPVSKGEAQRAAAAAASAAWTVVSRLKTASASLDSGNAQTDFDSLVRDIERVVHSASRGGISFIGNTFNRIAVRNGDLGGKVSLDVQSFDAESLGLIDASARMKQIGPAHLLQTAINLASDKASHLEKLHSALSSINTEDASEDLASKLAAATGAAMDNRGTLADLVA